MTQSQLHRIIAILDLLESLCNRDVAFRLLLAQRLSPQVFSVLVKKIIVVESLYTSSDMTLTQSFSAGSDITCSK